MNSAPELSAVFDATGAPDARDAPDAPGVPEVPEVPAAFASPANAPPPAITQSAIPMTSLVNRFPLFPCFARMASFLVITGSPIGLILTALPRSRQHAAPAQNMFFDKGRVRLDFNENIGNKQAVGLSDNSLTSLAGCRNPRSHKVDIKLASLSTTSCIARRTRRLMHRRIA
jgi:hypothetical protein